jgi:hypothetical protein
MAELKKKSDDPAEPGADDLVILHPDRTVKLRGKSYTVREYGFVEGLELIARVEPLIADLRVCLESSTAITIEQVHGLLGRHAFLVRDLAAISIDMPPEFVAGLTQAEGYDLLMWWWSVNGPFYVRCAVSRSQAALLAAKKSAGPMSSQPSSAPDTETTEISAA